jgi:hypothetical protein
MFKLNTFKRRLAAASGETLNMFKRALAVASGRL